MGAKRYFDDYLEMNKIDILNLNKKDKEEILNFMNDPAGVIAKKFKKDLNLTNEDIRAFRANYKAENDKINQAKIAKFNSVFSVTNSGENKLNAGKTINQIMHDNRGGFLERNFGWSSKEYKALTNAVKAAHDPSSPTYGDNTNVKIFASKYLEHKVPEGTDESRFSANEKRRIEFCRSVLATCDEIDRQKALEAQNEIIQDNNIINNDEFQNQIKNEINMENVKDDIAIDNNPVNLENNNEIEK